MTGRAAGQSERTVRFVELARTIRRAQPRCGDVRIVAVDGPGGAGKSEFADRLAQVLGGVPIVHTDDFASWDNPHGWWNRFELEVLVPLERGKPVRYQPYDWSARRLGGWQEIPRSGVVIIEGVLSSRQAAVDRLTLAIWVETPCVERLARGIARDGESMRATWEAWMVEEDSFFARDGTRERAHLIVDGSPSLPHDREAEFLSLIEGEAVT